MNIIALAGASCTGKTTIFEQLKKDSAGDPTVAFVEEAGRLFFAENNHLDLKTRFSKETQRKIQVLAQKLLVEAINRQPRLVICDRTVMDPVVFTRINTGDRGDDLFENSKQYVSRYDKIFLLSPQGIPFMNDNERHEGADMRDRLHKGFIEFFTEYDIPFTLVTGNREQRMRLVKTEIDKII